LVGPLLLTLAPIRHLSIPFGGVFLIGVLIGTTNILTAFAALVIIGVMMIALVHRLLWPFVCRPIYNAAEDSFIHQKKYLFGLSVLLLAYATGAKWLMNLR